MHKEEEMVDVKDTKGGLVNGRQYELRIRTERQLIN